MGQGDAKNLHPQRIEFTVVSPTGFQVGNSGGAEIGMIKFDQDHLFPSVIAQGDVFPGGGGKFEIGCLVPNLYLCGQSAPAQPKSD